VAERLNAAVLKTVDRREPVRGFESLPLRYHYGGMYGREVLTIQQIVKGNLNLDCPRDLDALAKRIPGIDREELRRVLGELVRRGEVYEAPRGYLRRGRSDRA
jgi:hypothetical protein